jgi:flavodoxin long chain
MASVTLIYGTTLGSTGEVAELIARELGEEDVRDVSSVKPGDFLAADLLILGTPTWDDGDLQQDWVSFLPKLDGIDLTGRKVALFGLGNAFSFPGQFANGLRKLHQKVVERGAAVIGFWAWPGTPSTRRRPWWTAVSAGWSLTRKTTRQDSRTRRRVGRANPRRGRAGLVPAPERLRKAAKRLTGRRVNGILCLPAGTGCPFGGVEALSGPPCRQPRAGHEPARRNPTTGEVEQH